MFDYPLVFLVMCVYQLHLLSKFAMVRLEFEAAEEPCLFDSRHSY